MSLFDDVFKSGGLIEAAHREQFERIQIEKMMGVEQRRIDQRRIDQMTQSTLQNSALNTYGTGLGVQMGRTLAAHNQAMQQNAVPAARCDPNNREAYLIPLSQAVTMWQVKHGDKWYDAQRARPPIGDFYCDVFDRIKKAELFESVDGWYRLKDNVENLLANH